MRGDGAWVVRTEGGGRLVKRFMGLRGSLTRPYMHDDIHGGSGIMITRRNNMDRWTGILGYRIYSLWLSYNLDLGIASFFGF